MPASDPRLLEAADRIGRRLCRDAIWSGGECNWMGWSMELLGRNWQLVYRAQPPTLYDGTAGIALFLAHLCRFTGDAVERKTLRGALRRSLEGAETIAPELQGSLYNGYAGIALACIAGGDVLQDERLSVGGVKLWNRAASLAPAPGWVDICNGSAGTVQAALGLHARTGAQWPLDLAVAHGQNLLASATRSDQGWSWDTMQTPGQKHLLGYAHGAAGIGCALADLGAATGEASFRAGAGEAFRYERNFFAPANRNWPDFRTQNGAEAAFSTAWCHGAPGIGLSRLRAYELGMQDEATCKELHAALEGTLPSISAPGASSYCLCHGVAGNADLFLESARELRRPELAERALQAGWNGMAWYEDAGNPWPCGVLGGGETPGLMLGTSGIGYFYLRLFDSAAVPSVLLMRGPGNQAMTGAPYTEEESQVI